MAMTVKRRKDTAQKKVIMHRIADIRGGVGVKTSELGGQYLLEGTPLGPAVNGLCSVVKVAKIVTAAGDTDKAYEVDKGHHFKTGDFVTTGEGKDAYAIASVDKFAKTKDVITVSTTLGETIQPGAFLIEAAAEATEADSALKVEPQSIVGTTYPVLAEDNIFTDAWLFAVTQGNSLPEAVASKLKGVINL